MKKIVRRVITFILLVTLTLQTPMQILASNEGSTYIKEMQIFSQKDFENYLEEASGGDKAKKNELSSCETWTSKNGFTVVNKNLNADTGQAAVYVGYTTTNKASEAITDTAVMDMKGGFSFAKYEELLKDQENDVKAKLDNFKPMLKEYQANYQANKATAVYAHDLMNLFIDGDTTSKYAGEGDKKDTGEKIGDYFLKTDISDDKLVKILIQSNNLLMTNVYYALAIACSDSASEDLDDTLAEKNWAEKMSKQKGVLSAKKYGDKAQTLVGIVGTLRETLKIYDDIKDELPLNATTEDIDAYKKENDISEEVMTNIMNAMQIYSILDSYTYSFSGGNTLADFFMQKKITAKQLYPLAASLTDGQFGTAYYAGLETLIQANGATKKEFEQAVKDTGASVDVYKEKIKELMDGKETLSIYEGVDRRLFFHGTACTDAEQRAESLNQDSYNPIYGNMDTSKELIMLGSMVISGTMAVVGTVKIMSLGATDTGFFGRLVDGFQTSFHYIEEKMVLTSETSLESLTANIESLYDDSLQLTNGSIDIVTRESVFKFGWRSALAIADCVMWAYTFTMIGVYLYQEMNSYYHPTMTEKPVIMMDYGEKAETGSSVIKYDAVMEYNEKGEEIVADLNVGEGKQWNVLYVSKDARLGTPLKTDYLYRTGTGQGVALDDYTAFHPFGEKNAFNLNKHCYKDGANGIYMFFKHEDTSKGAAQTGSVFGSGNVVVLFILICIGSVVVGAVAGFTVSKKKNRRQV